MATPIITGVEATIRGMQRMRQGDLVKMIDGVQRCVDIVYELSQKYVPVARGDLKASGDRVATGTGRGAEGIVVYGGPNAPHAFVVHERVEVPHAAPTSAKYVSRAVRERRGVMTRLMGRQLGAAVGGLK